jgi:hypothetical protein
VEGSDETPDEAPWTRLAEDEDPEPDWAERIRSGRKARGSTLRERYATFADEPTPLDDEPTPPHDEPPPPDDEAEPE